MKIIKNDCVGCPPEIGCLGSTCPYINVEYFFCDDCGREAMYIFEGRHYCQKCAEELVDSEFNELSVIEKAKCLSINMDRIK